MTDGMNLTHVPLDRIDWPENDRAAIDPDALTQLTQSVRAHGVLEPVGLLPAGDRFRGLWGSRRCAAAKAAGLSKIPALVRGETCTETEALELRLTENVARADLSNIELATALDRLMRAGKLSAAQVAARVGLSAAAVSKSLALLKLPPELQAKVGNSLSAAVAYELSLIADPADQARFAAEAIAGTLTRDGVKRRRTAAPSDVKPNAQPASRISLRLSADTSLSVTARDLTIERVIELLEQATRRCRSALKSAHTLATLARTLADEAKAGET